MRPADWCAMTFGQPSGPPATARQLRELLELLQAAGYEGFRDARGAMGFTQRQGNGKFTRDEADSFIAQLNDTAVESANPELSGFSDQALAEELQRRGWIVVQP